MTQILCGQCQTVNPIGQKLCSVCGSDLSHGAEVLCPDCGTANPLYLPHCIECGAALLSGGKMSSSREDFISSLEQHSGQTEDVEHKSVDRESESDADSSSDDWLKEFMKSDEPQSSLGQVDEEELRSELSGDASEKDREDWQSQSVLLNESQVQPPDDTSQIGQDNARDQKASHSEMPERVEAGESDWLNEMDSMEGTGDEPSTRRDSEVEISDRQPGKVSDDELDWVAEVTRQEEWDDEEFSISDEDLDDDVRLPDTAELPQTYPLGSHHEIDGIPQQLVSEEVPAWLSKEQPGRRMPEVAPDTEFTNIEDSSEIDVDSQVLEKTEQSDEQVDTLAAGSAEPVADVRFELDLPPDSPSWLTEIMQEAPSKAELDAAAAAEEVAEGFQDTPVDMKEKPIEEKGAFASLDDNDQLAIGRSSSEEVNQTQDLGQRPTEEELISELDSLKIEEEELTTESDWLAMLAKLPEVEEPPTPETSDQDEVVVESRSDVPDWLTSLQPRDFLVLQEDEDRVESDGPLAGLSAVIPIAAVVSSAVTKRSPSRFAMTKEQQEQVALLKRLTTVPPAPEIIIRKGSSKGSFLTVRIVFAVILIVVALIGWFIPSLDSLFPGTIAGYFPLGTEEAATEVRLLAGRPVLLAFDYSPAYAGEMDAVADILLQDLKQQNSPIVTVSTIASGVPLSERMVEEAGIDIHLPLGFIAGDAVALRNLGGCLGGTVSCEAVATKKLEPEQVETLERISLIVVLAADRDSLINWIEQIGPQSNSPMIAGMTQSIGPLALPYLKTGQLSGALEGVPGSISYANQIAIEDDQLLHLSHSSALTQWVAILLLIGGSLYFGLESIGNGRNR